MNQNSQNISGTVSALLNWFIANARDLPWRRTTDPYAIWISEIMLQQTQVNTVIPYWERWMRALPDISSLAQARPETVLKLWEGLGYYSRARNAQKAAQLIVSQHGGQFPQNFEEVLALPGIGRYTAGAICSIAYNKPTPILDGNVIRVLCRVFGIDGNPKEKPINQQLWDLAQALVTQSNASKSPIRQGRCSAFNQAIMELGALVCAPRSPQCHECPLKDLCYAQTHGKTAELPSRNPRPTTTPRRFLAFVVQTGDRLLVRQRPEGEVNAHLWEFPNVEVSLAEKNLQSAAWPFVLEETKPIGRIQHSITRYRITLEVFRAKLCGDPHATRFEGRENGELGKFKTAAQLRRLPFASAHRKILRSLGIGQVNP